MYIGNSPANIGNYQVVDDISSSFNGTTTSFALTSASQSITPVKSGQLLVSVNGVLQEPDDTGTNGFKVSSSNIVFSAAPASGSTFWGVYQGQNIDIGSPSDGAVTTAKLDPSGLELKHSSSTKLATTSTGIDVTGTVTADGLTVDGAFTSKGIDDNATSTAITIDSSENVDLANQADLSLNATSSAHVNRLQWKYGGTTYVWIERENSTGDMVFGVGGAASEKMRLRDGGGITFNGDTAAANALDDYEEGTVQLSSLSTSGGGTLSIFDSSPNYGIYSYVKIGDLCTIQAELIFDASLSGSDGDLLIPLPFNSAAPGALSGRSVGSFLHEAHSLYCIRCNGSSAVAKVEGTGGIDTFIQGSIFGNGDRILYTLTYRTV